MKLSTKLYNHFTIANNIEKLSGSIFEIDEQYNEYISQKRKLKTHQPQHLFRLRPRQILAVNRFVQTELNKPHLFLSAILPEIQEDIAIISFENGKDWLSYCHVSFPSGWKPEEVIGKSFQEIHKNIPGFVYNPNLPKILMSGRYQRTVWSPIFENKLNQYPGNSRPFTIDKPEFYLKIERQVTVGFPAEGCFLFVMRQYIFDESCIDFKVLCNTIWNMSSIQKQYKNISPEFESYLIAKDN